MVVKTCDGCGRQFKGPGKVHRLGTGGGSGVYLCRADWAKEMKWRKMRNKSLSKSAKFPIRKWPTRKRR